MEKYVTTRQLLNDGKKLIRTISSDTRVKPSWVNPRTSKSAKFSPECYMDGQHIIAMAKGCLPSDALVDRPHWTRLQLLEKLRQSSLDNAHYRIFGKRGKLITRLNELPHPQPKRLTFSAVSDTRSSTFDHGCELYRLCVYGASGRPMEDWRCRPMPFGIYNLGRYLWEKNHPFLTDLSRVSPPNSCQVNFYYSRFKGHIRKHRDNGIRDMGGCVHYMSTPIEENSQLHGTNVMTFSIGSPMEFTLHAFKDDKSGKNNAGMYTDTAGLTTTLEDGSCFLLHPTDDETHMHSARFVGVEYYGVRCALNFRWCVNEKWFYSDKHPLPSLRCAYANHVEMEKRQIQWQFLLHGKERNYKKREWVAEMVRYNCYNQHYFNS